MSSTPVIPGTDARAEYLAATQGIGFTKDFNPSLEALMMDRTATYGQRFLAWLKRRSWGNYRLYAVLENGEPATQADCSRELGIDKRNISPVVAFYEKRGYLYREGKLLYPTIAPKVAPLPQKVIHSPDFLRFLEDWKVTHSHDFFELEVARSTVKRINKVILSAYKKSRTSQTNGGPTLYKKKKSSKREEPPPPQPSVSLAEPELPKAEEEDRSLPINEPQAPTPQPQDLYQEFKKEYPNEHFDEPKAKPVFRSLKPAAQQRALARLRDPYLNCERWQDENGRWIPFASKFLTDEYFDAEPPPRLNRQQTRAKTMKETLDFMAMQDEFMANAKEINDALIHKRPLSKRQQELLDYMEAR